MASAVQPIDYTNVDFDALREGMLAYATEVLPEWTDRTPNDIGMLLIDLVAYGCDITQYYQTRIANNLLPGTSDEPEALVQLLRLIGYELRRPAPATTNLALWFGPAEPTPITIPARTQFTVGLASGEQVLFESESEVIIPASQLSPDPPSADLLYDRPLPVVQGQTVSAEQIGIGDGTPNQSYALDQFPVVDGSIDVTVDEPGGQTHWTEVETLADTTAADRTFIVQHNAIGGATVVFGDGASGMMPPLGTAILPTIIRATYRRGGGIVGNIPAATEFHSSLAIIRRAENDAGAGGGTDAESLERARLIGPNFYRTQNRAVTQDDFDDLTHQVGGVGKVLAVAANWNDIVLYVAPVGTVGEPTDLLKRQIHAYLESRRMASTRLVIRGPEPVDIYLRATINAEPHFLQSEVTTVVENAVEGYLNFEYVDFGQTVYLSRLYDLIQSLEQVASLNITLFNTDPDPASSVVSTGMIKLEPNQLPRLGYRDNPETLATTDPTFRPPIVTSIVGGIGG